MKSAMDCNVIQIIKTSIEANNLVKFNLDFDALQKWTEPIKDLEVAVVAVVGPHQTGKSLLLNLFGYHFDKSIEEQLEEQINGFESKASIDSFTTGLWLSKPYILTKSDGKQIAVLLLDTQSVFDGNISDDSSERIFWICLLISSCLVVNLTGIQGFLSKLDQFLQFMIKGDSGCAESLIFMIRDWNKRGLFQTGLSGGQKYLSSVLEIKNSPSEPITAKRLLKNCFKQISCYLMPGLGLKDEGPEFNGLVSELGSNFSQCLDEVMQNSMNASNLIPKKINNKFITGSELCLFIKVYVHLFNNSEKVNPLNISTATTKTLDLILITELKSQHLNLLKTLIDSKDFVSRKSLDQYHNTLCEDMVQNYMLKKKSDFADINEELIETLEEYLEANNGEIFDENEIKRNVFIRNQLEISKEFYGKLLNDYNKLNFNQNNFFGSEDLKMLFESNRKKVLDELRVCFADEEESLFVNELNELEKHFDIIEEKFTDENHKQMLRSKQENDISVDESISCYSTGMQKMLDTNPLLSDERFAELENDIKAKARLVFKMNCIFGNKDFIRSFDEKFRQRITDLKVKFKELNQKKRERMIVDQEIEQIDQFHLLLDQFDQSVGGIPEDCVQDQFNSRVEEIKYHLIGKLAKTYPKNLKEQFVDQLEAKKWAAIENFELNIHNVKMEQVKQERQAVQEQMIMPRKKKTTSLELETKTKEYFALYESIMRNSDGVLSLPEFSAKHNLAKSRVLKSFTSNESERSESFGLFVSHLKDKIDKSYENSLKPFQISLTKNITEITDERPQRGAEKPSEIAQDQKPVKLIELVSGTEYKYNDESLRSIVSKAKNCDNFALISIIGRKKSTKTFQMNCLKSFLETDNRKLWPKSCSFSYLEGFHTDQSDQNPAVYMWSEPFILEDDTQRTAVFLMDTSNVFDDRSELTNTKLVEDISGLFFNTSSTVVYMNDTLLSPKEVQNLKSLVVKSIENTPMDKLQELICVIRDWDPNRFKDRNYSLGQRGGDLYLDYLNRLTNHDLKDNFESLHCYLLPSSGSHFKDPTVEFDRLDKQFLAQLSHLIRWKLFNIDEIVVKKNVKTHTSLKPTQLLKLFRSYVNKINGLPESTAMDDSDDYHPIYDSGDSIEVLNRDFAEFDQVRSYYSDDENILFA